MGKTEKDKINWHRFHNKVDKLPTEQKEKVKIMDQNGAGLRHGNKRAYESVMKVKKRRVEKRIKKDEDAES
jgi:hypothetical protein